MEIQRRIEQKMAFSLSVPNLLSSQHSAQENFCAFFRDCITSSMVLVSLMLLQLDSVFFPHSESVLPFTAQLDECPSSL